MKGIVIKFLASSVVLILLFIAVNNFLCSPSGFAPEIVGVKKSEIIEFNNKEIKLSIIVSAKNKNDFNINVEDMFVYIVNNTDTIGNAERKEKFSIESRGTADIDFSSMLITDKILKLLSEGIDTLNLKLIGNATANLGFISLPVDIDVMFKVMVKEQLAGAIERDTKDSKIIEVKSAGLKKLSLGESVVDVEFVIMNPYGIEFSVKEYPSTIFINGKESGSGNITGEIQVKKTGTGSAGIVSYKLSNSKTLTSLFNSLFSRKLEYETVGNLLINILGYDIQFPYRMKGVLIKI
ncbi:late embryogenesis abundant protein [bacterium BMS3Abin03]|nr:late embryogenesis abundant protein [bacterium BMS3Abin03]